MEEHTETKPKEESTGFTALVETVVGVAALFVIGTRLAKSLLQHRDGTVD